MNKNRELPRRVYVDQYSLAEKAIYDAIQAVEAMPPDTRLTDAVVLLAKAKDCVSDYIDGANKTLEPAQEVQFPMLDTVSMLEEC